MSLKYLAYPVDYLDQRLLVIDDGSLLEWAHNHNLPPWRAQLEAVRSRILPLRYLKNFWSLGYKEQEKICSSEVFVCGCGGLGGILIHLLARAGVGRIRVADRDIFFPTNLNRQILCDVEHLSRPKVHVIEERMKAVNPLVHIAPISVDLNRENADELIHGSDLVLDALDNVSGRFVLAEAARLLGIPFIHAAASGWWGQIGTFLPDSPSSLSDVYGKMRSRELSEETAGILGPTAAVIGSLEALEALRILSGREPAYSGKLLYFDGESGGFEMVPLEQDSRDRQPRDT